MKRLKAFLVGWLVGTTLDEQQTLIDSLTFFAADTCDTVNALDGRVAALENERAAVKPPSRRLRVKPR